MLKVLSTTVLIKQSLLHYPSQQPVYTKMMIEGISKLFKQPPYRICDDRHCFTKNLNLAKSIQKTKEKL